MSLLHRCHTCNQQYENIAKYCPGCGKQLGHRIPRSEGNVNLIEDGDRLRPFYRCSGCGHTTDGLGYSFCPYCGAYVNVYKIRPSISDEYRRLEMEGVAGNLFEIAAKNVASMDGEYRDVKPYEFYR